MPERFDPDQLDPDDPFEVDAVNRPHLYKHTFLRPDGRTLRIELPDVLDLYVWNAGLFYPADPADGDAHWLFIGEIEGVVISVPLAPPQSGDPRKCRPIGLNVATNLQQDRYRQDRRRKDRER